MLRGLDPRRCNGPILHERSLHAASARCLVVVWLYDYEFINHRVVQVHVIFSFGSLLDFINKNTLARRN